MPRHCSGLWVAAFVAGGAVWPSAAREPRGDQTGKGAEKPAATTAGTPAPTWEARAARFGGTEWITRPSRDTTMEFPSPVEVAEVAVVGGQAVRRGQLLVRGKDYEARAALAAQRVRAANDTEVRNAKANLELAQSRFDAALEAKSKDALAAAEYDERRIAVETGKIAVDAAEQRLKEEQLRAVQLEEQAKRYRIEAPFDGVIDQVYGELGQSLGENKPVVRIVSIDPMWIDVPVETDRTLVFHLSEGSPAWTLLDVPGADVVIPARVLYVAPTASAASSTRLVRVEVPNRAGWPAGTRARVRFEAPSADWNSAGPSGARAQADGAPVAEAAK